jgi:hypothetical protein
VLQDDADTFTQAFTGGTPVPHSGSFAAQGALA